MNFSPSLYVYLGLPGPKCNTLYLVLFDLFRKTRAHSSGLSRSLWMASLLLYQQHHSAESPLNLTV